jgi:hypothetical protein
VTDYLRLDLLCIPQLEFNPVQRDKERDKENAKQAGIFANSTACVAWLNDVKDWERLLPAVTWPGLSYLEDDPVLLQDGLDTELLKLTHLVDDGHRLFQKQYNKIHSVADGELKEINMLEDSTAGVADFHARYCCSRTVAECRALSRQPVIPQHASSDLNQTFAFPDWFTSLWTFARSMPMSRHESGRCVIQLSCQRDGGTFYLGGDHNAGQHCYPPATSIGEAVFHMILVTQAQ